MNKTEEFINKSIKIHKNKYNYSLVKYKNNRTKVEIICLIHGLFNQSPDHHLNKGCGCPKCGGKYKLTKEDFVSKSREIHGDKYEYTLVVYINAKTPVEIICKIHGIFKQRPNDHSQQGQGCAICGKIETSNKLKMTINEFIRRSNEIHNNKYSYDDVKYVNKYTNVIIKCDDHGNFNQTPHNHLAGKGCSKCSKKNYSKKQIQWLTYIASENNINIQHAENGGEFEVGKYYIDGYCKENNTCYEFHGNFYHGNPRIYDENDIQALNGKKMGDLYKATIKKEEFIKSKGYNLVVIWEDEWDVFIKMKK